MSKCCLQTATSKYAHPRLVNCISFFHIPNNCFSKTFSYHLCLKNTHIGLTTHFTNQTHWCTSYGLLNLLLVNTSLLFFSIFPTLRVFFNFYFWFIICLLFFKSFRLCFLWSWGVYFWFILFLWYFNMSLGIRMLIFIQQMYDNLHRKYL